MIAVLRVPSSADKSHWTDARVRHRGKSLIKMQNRIFMITINSSMEQVLQEAQSALNLLLII